MAKPIRIPLIFFPFSGSYPISLPFGTEPADNATRLKYREWKLNGHNGVDFMLPEGTDVIAADKGKIIQCGENGDFGNSITIQHRWGTSLYAHLKKITVTNKQKVKRGEVIGLSGNSGFSSGPHLHFSIKPLTPDESNGYFGYIDPTQFFKKLQKRKSRTKKTIRQ